ncbi:MAG: amino acid ABC transporter permease [Oscillospiraceae bacterium]|nr:amino acid ABC transporter permease [Oscillospiraceae bacterium]
MLSDIPNLIKMFLVGSFPQGPLGGLAINAFLAIVTMASGFVLGLLLALGRISKNTLTSRIITFVIETTRALPLLLIVFWFYFFIPLFAERPLPTLLSAFLSLTFYSAVNQAEIFRGGLMNVAKGQWQVAYTTGLSYVQCMINIILPQVLRMMLPSFAGFFISLFKDTSVIYIIGIVELTQVGIMLSQREPDKLVFSYILVAAMFFGICFILSFYAKKWEAKQLKWFK